MKMKGAMVHQIEMPVVFSSILYLRRNGVKRLSMMLESEISSLCQEG